MHARCALTGNARHVAPADSTSTSLNRAPNAQPCVGNIALMRSVGGVCREAQRA